MIKRMGMLIILIFIASMFLTVYSANAQTVCGERASLLKQLEGNYKEALVSMGLASNGSIVELTKSDEGTWTILLTSPKGLTCLIAAGEHWEVLKQKKSEPS